MAMIVMILRYSKTEEADKVGNAIERGDYNPKIGLCKSICKVLKKRWMNCFGRSNLKS